MILISPCKRIGRERSLFRNCYLVSSRNVLSLQREIDGIVWRDQTIAAQEITISMVPMHFIFA